MTREYVPEAPIPWNDRRIVLHTIRDHAIHTMYLRFSQLRHGLCESACNREHNEDAERA